MAAEIKQNLPSCEEINGYPGLSEKIDKLKLRIEAFPEDRWPIPVKEVVSSFRDPNGLFPKLQFCLRYDYIIRRAGILKPIEITKKSVRNLPYPLSAYNKDQVLASGILCYLIEKDSDLTFNKLVETVRSITGQGEISEIINNPISGELRVGDVLSGYVQIDPNGKKVGRPSKSEKEMIYFLEKNHDKVNYKGVIVKVPKFKEEQITILKSYTEEKLDKIYKNIPGDLYQTARLTLDEEKEPGVDINAFMMMAASFVRAFPEDLDERLRRLAKYDPSFFSMEKDLLYWHVKNALKICLDYIREKKRFPNLWVLYQTVEDLVKKG